MLDLTQEELVALEPREVAGLRQQTLVPEDAHRQFLQIDDDLAGVAKHHASAGRRSLQIVLVNVYRHSVTVDNALEEGADDILNVDLEPAEMPSQGEDPTREAEQPVHVVELVDLGENDSSSQICTGRVHLPVVLVRVPSRQVFTDFDVHGDDPPDCLLRKQFLESQETRMKPHLVPNQSHRVALVHEFDKLIDLAIIVRERLFDKEATTRRRRLQRHLHVETGRITHKYGVRLALKRGIEVGYGSDAVLLLNVASRLDLQAVIQSRGIPAHAICGDVGIRPEKRP